MLSKHSLAVPSLPGSSALSFLWQIQHFLAFCNMQEAHARLTGTTTSESKAHRQHTFGPAESWRKNSEDCAKLQINYRSRLQYRHCKWKQEYAPSAASGHSIARQRCAFNHYTGRNPDTARQRSLVLPRAVPSNEPLSR